MPPPEKGLLLATRVSTANPAIQIQPDSQGGGSPEAVTIPLALGTDYWPTGDGQATSGREDLLALVDQGLDTNTDPGSETYTTTIDADGFVTITADTGNPFRLLWADAGTTIDPTLLGFTAVDSGHAASHTAPDAVQGLWLPAAPMLSDTYDVPQVVGRVVHTSGGGSRGSQHTEAVYHRGIRWDLLPREVVRLAEAAADRPFGTLEWFWLNGAAAGHRFRVYDDWTSRTFSSYSVYRFRETGIPYRRMRRDDVNLWEASFALIRDSEA